ncbi:MAG: hypothetical protein GF335_02490 [Candidatus Moranbacteria bacterium]|nr:hypothetical protein [Candidatus Moranbacteria bacterium]
MNKQKDWLLFVIKCLIIITLVFCLILLFSTLSRSLNQENNILNIFKYLIVIIILQSIFFALILTLSKDFFDFLEKIKQKKLQKYAVEIKKISVYSTPSLKDQLHYSKVNFNEFQKSKKQKDKIIFFERTYNLILNEQIEILLTLKNSRLTFSQINKLFEKSKNLEIEKFKHWTTEDFLYIFLQSKLVNKTNKNYKLTKIGLAFLDYLKKRDYIS